MLKYAPKFKCPKCNRYTIARVMDTRIAANCVFRRRICEWCGATFITREVMDHVSRNVEVEVR